MANLAIKGHPIRGRELITLLEMLGGVDKYSIYKTEENLLYCLRSGDNVIIATYPSSSFSIFTLEEFLEKYPYKVGDKVLINDDENDVHTISSMHWDDYWDKVVYRIASVDGMVDAHVWFADEMEPYKKQISHKEAIRDYIAPKQETNEDLCLFKIDLKNAKASKEIEVILGDYEFVLKDGKTYFIKKQPQYPKNYCECCEVLDAHPSRSVDSTFITGLTDYEDNLSNLMSDLYKLLICRDAYWKIAGKEMGLGEPWKPLDDGITHKKYVIQTVNGEITKLDTWCKTRNILELPTPEMRDVFYEHFKDLIEMCKEFI